MDLHVLFPDGLVARVDAVLGPGQSRSDWIRRAVEQALEGQQKRGNAREAEERDVVNREPSKPAEQPEAWREVQADRAAGANPVRPAREFRPYPKGGGG